MPEHKAVTACRICGNSRLTRVLDLGSQMLTGVFPRSRDSNITVGPLRLVKCTGSEDVCGLLQLEHSYDLAEMYGETYGYRSGLNPSMVAHLHGKVRKILDRVKVGRGDLVVDIGSNDGTALRAYPESGPLLVGIDPTVANFREHYRGDIQAIPEFFSAELVRTRFPGKLARVVTSFSMFYDLESPVAFMKEVRSILAEDGIWVFEQSYMPAMLRTNSFDTVCHEHLEFYALRQIKWMADRLGFKILDVEFNDVNGGSFSMTVAKSSHPATASALVEETLGLEREAGLDALEPYREFAERSLGAKVALLDFIRKAKSEGKTVAGLGASTKGNVLLQYCGITEREIPCIGEVNAQKVGCLTPGTWLPIIAEKELLQRNPDYLLVLPWHFKQFFMTHPAFRGRNLVFPLPSLEVACPR